MNKQELLSLVNKGIVKIGNAEIEVTMGKRLNSDYIHIKQKAINQYTTDHEFSGGWVEYITDDDVAGLENAIFKVHEKMLKQAEICKRKPMVMTSIKDTDLLVSDSGQKYIIQRPAKDHFEIYTLFNAEPDCPINVPVLIDGKLHLPVWSWWLDKGCYLVNQKS